MSSPPPVTPPISAAGQAAQNSAAKTAPQTVEEFPNAEAAREKESHEKAAQK